MLASFLTKPLEVIAVWLGVAGLFGGAASALGLLGGRSGAEIADAAQRGAALGFVIGFLAAVMITTYYVA